MLTDRDKTYEAVLLLGISTDTQDISGDVIDHYEGEFPDEDQVRECICSFEGVELPTESCVIGI